jgi:reactive intermediate/imine deaminase
MNKQVYGEPIMVGGAMRMPLSRAVRAGDWVFLSGVAAIDSNGAVVTGGIEAQTQAVLEVIRDVLKLADCEMSDVVKTTVWLHDTRDFWSFNRVYATFFPDDPPARSTLKSELMLDAKVEIEALAYKPL